MNPDSNHLLQKAIRHILTQDIGKAQSILKSLVKNQQNILINYFIHRLQNKEIYEKSILQTKQNVVIACTTEASEQRLKEYFDLARNCGDFELAVFFAKKLLKRTNDLIYVDKVFHSYWDMTQYDKAYRYILRRIKKNKKIPLRLLKTIIRNLYGARDFETGFIIANYAYKQFPTLLRLQYLAAYFLMRQNKFSKSHSLWRKRKPSYHSQRWLVVETKIAFELGDFNALRKLLKELKLKNKPQYYYFSGRYNLWLGKLSKVKKRIHQLNKLQESIKYNYLQAVVFALNKKNKEALNLFNSIEANYQNDKEFFAWRCEVKRRLKDYTGTRYDNEASRQFGYNLASHINQILIQFDQGLGENAIAKPSNDGQEKLNHILYLEELARNLPMLKVKDGNWPQAFETLLQQLAGNRSHIVTIVKNNKLKLFKLKAYARVTCRRVQLLVRTRGIQKSVNELKKLIHQYPYSAHPLTHIGEIYLWKGQYKKAEMMFRKALQKTGYVSWANIGLIASLFYQQQDQEALSRCENYEKDFPPAPTLYIYVGEHYIREKNLVKAKEYLEKAIFYRNNRITSYIMVCLYYIYQSRLDDAHKLFHFIEKKITPLFIDIYESLNIKNDVISKMNKLEEILFETLNIMRGNRSSVLITYYHQGNFKFCNIEWWDKEFPHIQW